MKKIIILFSLSLLIILSIIVFNDQDEKVLSNNSLEQDLNNMIGVYLEDENSEYVSSSDIPQKDDGYKFSKAVCENDIEVKWNEDAWSLIVPNNIANFKCNLYFDQDVIARDTILAHYDTVLTRNNFSTTITSTTTGTIYKSLDETQYDNDGEVYYFAGNPTDNWVKFGGFYWRIIRINGNGSIRMIYQGTSANSTGANTQIQAYPFNGNYYRDNAYVGYMYASGNVHGLVTSGGAKLLLENWYQSNLTNVLDKIDGNAGFCGDRQPSTSISASDGLGGTYTTQTYYGAYIRLITNKSPSFKCINESDLYTSSGSKNGNKALTYPIGLITADEVAYAGGLFYQTDGSANNEKYYLHTGQTYWLMSPCQYNEPYDSAVNFFVDSAGYLSYGNVNADRGIRPVINLKEDVTITGSGTTTDPYVVS